MTFGLFSPAANLCQSGWAVVVALFRPFPRCGSIVRYLWSSTAVLCQSVWSIVNLFFLTLLSPPLRYLRAVGRSDSRPTDDAAPYTELGRPNEPEKPQANPIAGVRPNREEIERKAVSDSPSLSPNAESGRLAASQHNMIKSESIKRYLKRAIVATETITKKLVLLPRILMFMPMDLILLPGSDYFGVGFYLDAREKIHNKSSLKLLFNEDDMDWIMSMIFYCEHVEARPLLYFSAIAGAAFGSIHCAAWNFAFPSLVEKIMWRTASLSLVGVCVSIFPGLMLYEWAAYHFWDNAQRGSLMRRIWDLLSTPTFNSFIPVVIYPIARLTLLLLALSSLRGLHSTESALQTIEWIKFIPHI